MKRESSLNSDGQQLHQYQPKEEIPLLPNTKQTTIHVTIQIQTWDRHTHMAELNRLMESHPSSLNYPIYNGNIVISNRKFG